MKSVPFIPAGDKRSFDAFVDLGVGFKSDSRVRVKVSLVFGFMKDRFTPEVAADRKGSRSLGQAHSSAASEK